MNPAPTFAFISTFKRVLGFGFLCSFLSGFGQTYFVSLFVPSLSERLSVAPGDIGPFYAVATLCSGLLLSRVGKHADLHGESAIFFPAGMLLASGLLLLSRAGTLWWLFPAFFAIRFGGQGMLGLLSGTTMARNFVNRRGMALSIASLGYPAGEILLPGLVVGLLSYLHWSWVLPLLAMVLLLGIFLLGGSLLRKPLRGDVPLDPHADDPSTDRPFRWYRAPLFIGLMLASGFSGSFTGTILFFFQLPIAETKSWSPAWMATCFSVFAFTRASASILSGPLIDRWSGARMLPMIVFPVPFALLMLRWGQAPATAMIYYILLGFGFGFGGAQTAFLAERYGRRIIGQVRGVANAFMVIFSAAGPFCAGMLLKRGWNYEQLLDALFLSSILCFLGTFAVVQFHKLYPSDARKPPENAFRAPED